MIKRFLVLSCLLVLVGNFAMADRITLDETKTRVAFPLSQAPVIDGVINADEWLYATGTRNSGFDNYWLIQFDEALEDFVRGGNNPSTVTGGPLYAEDMQARIWVGYDNDNLYVAVRVIDDVLCDDSAEAGSANGSTWLDDSVEVFVDGDNSNFATRDTTGTNAEIVATGGQYVITINNAYREAEAGNPGYGPSAAWYAQCVQTDTGYDAEFRISLKTIGAPKLGDIIGFTVAINDDDTFDDELDNQYTWIGATHEEATYGNLIFGKQEYKAPKLAAPTVDGVVNSAEYAGAEEIVINTFTGVHDIGSGDDAWPIGDHDFSAWVTHDDQAIYVGVSVTDDIVMTDTAEAGSVDGSTWEDDAVELFIDFDNTNDVGHPSTVVGDGQYVLTANGARRTAEANSPVFGTDQDWYGASSLTSKGYDVEFKISKAIMGNPADGASIGFMVGINDDDGAGRKAQLGWCGIAHNESSYGKLTLGAGGSPIREWALY